MTSILSRAALVPLALVVVSSAALLTSTGCGDDGTSGGWNPGSGGVGVAQGGSAGKSTGGTSGHSGTGGANKGGSNSGGSSTGGSSTGGSGGSSTGGSSTGGSSTGGSSTGGSSTGGTGGGSGDPVCLGSQAGAYCGNDEMENADPNTLYKCPGKNQAPTSATPCPEGCIVESAGTADHCKAVTSPGGYKLPWAPGTTMQLTQDCNDACCNDHVNDDQWAWDFANGSNFTIVAARGGTVSHLKINSTSGCGSSSCVNSANYIVIDHGDGTQSVYLHLEGGSLASGVTCGSTVKQGQPLARAGTTGWSTGDHLHFQVSQVHTGVDTCECGGEGNGCSAGSVNWSTFWSTASFPTVSIQFDEWPEAPNCANRRFKMPASQNN